MDFEWDEDKRRINLQKHRIDLLDAAVIFNGETVVYEDGRHDYTEDRFVAIGYAEDACYVVIYAERDGRLRLISARYGGRRDRRRYQKGIAGRDTGDEGAG